MIEINNISKSYNEVKALEQISLSIKENELFGLIGPDGSGKTSLFRLITTLLIPDSGTISVSGFDTVNDFKEIRKITGYMPGRFSLYQDLTVEENLEFYATVFGTSIKENYDLIKDIYAQIEPFKKRRAGKLSGGMKQKLALSCALIHKPKVLILDEPTTGVDAVSRAEFWQMLKKLKSHGITIVVSTPYMDEAMLCDRVGLIHQGNLFKTDRPEQIVKDFDQELFAVKANNKYKLIQSLRNMNEIRTAFAFGESIHISFHQNVDLEIIQSSLEKELNENIKIEQIQAGIEDYFLDFTNQE